MQDKGTPRMFRVKAVAELYDVSVSTIYRAIESGQLDAYRIGAGKGAIRIPAAALAAFEESCVLETWAVTGADVQDTVEEVA